MFKRKKEKKDLTGYKTLEVWVSDNGDYVFDPKYYVDTFVEFLNNNPEYKEKVRDVLGLNGGMSFGGETVYRPSENVIM